MSLCLSLNKKGVVTNVATLLSKNYSIPTITEVAFITAYASLPTESSSSSTAFFEILEEI